MKTVTQCGVCKENLLTRTKGEAMHNLLTHIRQNHPLADLEIEAGRQELRELAEQRRDIRERVRQKTGYLIPGW